MNRAESLTRELRHLSTRTPGIEAAAVVDDDGLVIASALPEDLNEEQVAAMSASLRGMSERSIRELNGGLLSMVMVQGSKGSTVLAPCSAEAVLTVLTPRGAKLGLIFHDIERAASEFGRLLGQSQ